MGFEQDWLEEFRDQSRSSRSASLPESSERESSSGQQQAGELKTVDTPPTSSSPQPAGKRPFSNPASASFKRQKKSLDSEDNQSRDSKAFVQPLLYKPQGPFDEDEGSDEETDTMSENAPPATAIGTDDDPTRGMPYHDKVTSDLKSMLQKKRMLERTVTQQDETIFKKETDYLESTPYGNIITGFDNYIKGSSSSVPGGRRKMGVTDSDRVFSRSSLRYNDSTDSPGPSSAHTTPSHAPTPVNTSFLKEAASNNATPTSATSANKSGAGLKKNKKNGEDSETDSKETKKVRTNFGAGRNK